MTANTERVYTDKQKYIYEKINTIKIQLKKSTNQQIIVKVALYVLLSS